MYASVMLAHLSNSQLSCVQMVNTIQWYVLSLTLSTALQVDGE